MIKMQDVMYIHIITEPQHLLDIAKKYAACKWLINIVNIKQMKNYIVGASDYLINFHS